MRVRTFHYGEVRQWEEDLDQGVTSSMYRNISCGWEYFETIIVHACSIMPYHRTMSNAAILCLLAMLK